jgi:cytoskeleton protein RodZ
MGSFGDRLKKEREQRGITLDDISLTTKIGTRLLRALEEEKFEQLPGGIFNKGFVRAYARHVGLDEDQAVADYMTATGANQPPIEENTFPVQAPERAPASLLAPRIHVVREGRGTEPAAEVPWGLLAILLLVIALGFASWSYFHRTPEVEQKKIAPPPASSAETAPATGAAVDSGSHGAAPSPDKVEPAPVNGTAPVTPIPTTEQISTQPSPVAQAGLQASAPLSGPAATPGSFIVRLKGNDDSEECWVSIVVDGQPPIEATLVAPYEKVVQARNEVTVKAGNIGALDLFFNSKKLPSQGEYGTVRTLVFHADGLQSPPVRSSAPTQ